MARCGECGFDGVVQEDLFCQECGTRLVRAVETAVAPVFRQQTAGAGISSSFSFPGDQAPSRLGAAAWIIAASLMLIFFRETGTWAMILVPSMIGALWPLIRSQSLTAKLGAIEAKIQAVREKVREKKGKLSRFLVKPFCGACLLALRKTSGIADIHLRAGIQAALLIYIAAIGITLLAVATYAVVIIILAIVVVAIALWVLSAFLSDGPSRRGGDGAHQPTRAAAAWMGSPQKGHFRESGRVVGESRPDTDWLGNPKTVHYDTDGKKAGESRPDADWLGNPKTVHYDTDGKKAGESRPDTDWLGNPKTVHYDTDGKRTGESRPDTDWLGNPKTVHYDTDGNKTGESRPDTDWLGNPVTRHELKKKE